MAVLFSETFEGGSNGAACTTANTAFDQLVEPGWTFSNTQVEPDAGDTLSGRCGATGGHVIARGALAAATATPFLGFPLYVSARPAGNTDIARFIDAAAGVRAGLQLGANGQMRMRNAASAAVLTTADGLIPLNTWCRVEWAYSHTAGTQQLRVYVGANRHGTTPDYDSGPVATTAAGTADMVHVGVLTAATMTMFVDNVVVDGATWPGPAVAPSATEWAASGGVLVPLEITAPVNAAPPPPPPSGGPPPPAPGGPVPPPRIGHEWAMFSRTATYGLNLALPIASARFVLRHMGVSTAVCTTPFTPARWESLAPSSGIELYRDGRQEFTGRLTARQVDWDAESGRAVIKVEAVGDEQLLKDRLTFPDPLRAADDQTVNDYWQSRTGASAAAKPASTAMLQLIADQAGATCRADRRIPGLTLGPDPVAGLSRVWSGLFNPVFDQLALMSVASGANLGLRMSTTAGALTATITAPRDLTRRVKFSADLRNLAGFSYREETPTATHALSAGQGDLHLRLRKLVATTSALALRWGRQIWSYIDRRDTADTAELQQASEDELAGGDATVSLAVTLTDSQAATYGRDWDLGDKITISVGLPGQVKVAAVSDVVREIAVEVTEDGKEKITPAIGSYDAKAVIPTPTQKQLAAVGSGLSGLIARK